MAFLYKRFMPVVIKKDKEGSYAQWGSKAKYYFDPEDEKSKQRAIEKAIAQGAAVYIDKNK